MFKVGITGNIGSGKTTVSKVFECMNIPVYYSDDRAKFLMRHDTDLISLLSKEFGNTIYVDGELQTKMLAQTIFGDDRARLKLNSMVHPFVFKDFDEWVKKYKRTKFPFVLHEAALIFEVGAEKNFDKVIIVIAKEETRIARVMKRDGATEEAVRQRMASQMSEDEKRKRSDYIIWNDDCDLSNISLYFQVRHFYADLLIPFKK